VGGPSPKTHKISMPTPRGGGGLKTKNTNIHTHHKGEGGGLKTKNNLWEEYRYFLEHQSACQLCPWSFI